MWRPSASESMWIAWNVRRPIRSDASLSTSVPVRRLLRVESASERLLRGGRQCQSPDFMRKSKCLARREEEVPVCVLFMEVPVWPASSFSQVLEDFKIVSMTGPPRKTACVWNLLILPLLLSMPLLDYVPHTVRKRCQAPNQRRHTEGILVVWKHLLLKNRMWKTHQNSLRKQKVPVHLSAFCSTKGSAHCRLSSIRECVMDLAERARQEGRHDMVRSETKVRLLHFFCSPKLPNLWDLVPQDETLNIWMKINHEFKSRYLRMTSSI